MILNFSSLKREIKKHENITKKELLVILDKMNCLIEDSYEPYEGMSYAVATEEDKRKIIELAEYAGEICINEQGIITVYTQEELIERLKNGTWGKFEKSFLKKIK